MLVDKLKQNDNRRDEPFKDYTFEYIISDSQKITELIENNKIDFYSERIRKKKAVLSDNDVDDEYLLYLAGVINEYCLYVRRANKNLKKHNSIVLKNKCTQALMKCRDAALARITDKSLNEKEEIKKQMRRAEISVFWNTYASLLKEKQIQRAYDYLESDASIGGTVLEKAKFKKGLFGLKYVGELTESDINKLIEHSAVLESR